MLLDDTNMDNVEPQALILIEEIGYEKAHEFIQERLLKTMTRNQYRYKFWLAVQNYIKMP